MEKKKGSDRRWWLFGAAFALLVAIVAAVLMFFVFDKKKSADYDDEDEDDEEELVEERKGRSHDRFGRTSDEMVGKQDAVDETEEVADEGNYKESVKDDDEVTEVPVVTVEDSEPYDIVEVMPQFPGNMMEWLSMHLKYPPAAMDNGVEGRVVCSFVVETDGSLSNVQVVRSVNPDLDEEAVRVIKEMPQWSPGKQDGKPVRVKFTLPISFKLQ